jgi:hypothetical protein
VIIDSNEGSTEARLASLGTDAIRDFLLRAPRGSDFRNVMHKVPGRRGFRDHSEPQFRYQATQIAKALLDQESSIERDTAERIYGTLWRLMADKLLGGYWTHPTLLKNETGSVEELLLRISTGNREPVSREDVRDVLSFAPFDLPNDLEQELNILPSANELITASKVHRLDDEVSQIKKTLDSLVDAAEKNTRAEPSDETIVRRLDLLENRLTATADQLDGVATERVGAEIKKAESRLRIQIEKSVADLDERRGSLTEDSRRAEQAISNKLSELETAIADLRVATSKERLTGGADSALDRSLLLQPKKTLVSLAEHGSVAALESPKELSNCLETTLLAIGLAEKCARKCAAQIAAGLMSTRWVTLYGSLSSEIGRAVMHAICGNAYNRATVSVTNALAITRHQAAECMLFIGADRAPVEVFAGSYRQSAIARIRGRAKADDPFTLAVCEGGASAMPLSEGLASLGPVIATDCLQWRGGVRSSGIPRGVISSALRDLTCPAAASEDIQDSILKPFLNHALWESSLKRYMGVLRKFPAADEDWAVITGYLGPRIATTGGPIPEANSISGFSALQSIVRALKPS